MVAQHLFPPTAASEQTLDVVWRAAAERVSLRSALLLFITGIGGVMVRAVTGRFTILASVGILTAAFAAYSMITRSGRGQNPLPRRVARVLAGMLKIAAAIAGIATALLLLGAVFGGSLEVMRH